MKKMKTLFEQDESFRVVDKIREESRYLIDSVKKHEYSVSRKRDGTSVMIKDGKMYKRYDANKKKGKKVPVNAIPCQEEAAPNGSFPVWVPCNREDPSDKFHYEAFDKNDYWEDATYELCGPKINGNKERLDEHILIQHGLEVLIITDFTYEGVRDYLENNHMEGFVVKNNKTGEMTKIRRKDYGLKW